MTAYELSIHLLNFAAPAFFVALLLTCVPRMFGRKRASAPPLWAQWAVVFATGLAALGGGLAWFGHDGMIATYAVLVVASGTARWLVGRGFSR